MATYVMNPYGLTAILRRYGIEHNPYGITIYEIDKRSSNTMKKFLASVGHAQLLGKVNGEFVHIADVQTLTESTLSFSNTMEEIRAGQGAKLYGRFAHDSGMTVSLTEAMFDMQYIGWQVGSLPAGNATAFEYEDFTAAQATSGSVTLSSTPASIGVACGLQDIPVWFRAKGCAADAEWKVTILDSATTTVEVPDGIETTNGVCVKYFKARPEASMIQVRANFIPAELILILTTKLFAGDANAPETGKPVGEITVKVPRFQLDGTFDLSMAMSSAATISLNGTALAVSDGSCEDEGIYAEIVEVIVGSTITDGLKMIAFDPDSVVKGAAPSVYGIYGDNHVSLLPNASPLTFTPALSDGVIPSSATTLTVAVGSLSDTATVKDA